MPVQMYDRELILLSCRTEFARHGYKDTSTAALAEAAGVSKSLIFHHFGSKKELYLSILDDCLKRARSELNLDKVPEYLDFFAAMLTFNRMKLHFFKHNPDVYRVITEALHTPADEILPEIAARYPALLDWKGEGWRSRFAAVPLKEGIDRQDAFELITGVVRFFGERFLSEVTAIATLDVAYELHCLTKLSNFLGMIRDGIEDNVKEDTK